MFSINTLLFFTLALLAASPVAAIAISYQTAATTNNIYSSFPLGYVSGGTNISIFVTPGDNSASYNVLLWRPNTAAPADTPFKNLGPYTGQKSLTVLTDDSGNWRIQVLPNGPDFIFGLDFYVYSQLINKFYGVASYGHVFTAYYNSPGSFTATLNIFSGSITDVTFSIFGPFTYLAVSGGSQIASTIIGTSSAQITYYTQGKQFYYIIVKPSLKFLTLGPQIALTYQTDLYLCPYNQGVSDINGYFQGCSSNSPTQGPPCITNDPITGYCILCAAPFINNSMGVCVQSTICNQDQYWHYGACHDVIKNCVTFQKIAGYCQECRSGYKLINYDNGTQLCDELEPICGDNQYLVDKKCYNNVANCANFVILNGTCLSCSYGYKLIDNTCVIVDVAVFCPVGQTAVNGHCQLTDPFCIFYGNSSQYQLCATGWKFSDLTGLCTKIICGGRQCSYKGFCDDISPFCDTFDTIYGTCKSCIPNYYLQLNGTCVQSFRGVVSSQSLCTDGYYLSGTTCVQVSPLCYGYNSTTGQCTSCKDTAKFYLISGVCQNISSYCANNYRTYFSNGVCVPISELCNQFDASNGRCITCTDQTYLDPASGRCKFNQTCGAKQYYGIDGNCLDGNQNCSSIDQNTGNCLGCQSGFDLNGNTCCKHDFYIATNQCKGFLGQNCLVYNEINGCLVCKNGFSKPEGLFFTKCVANSS